MPYMKSKNIISSADIRQSSSPEKTDDVTSRLGGVSTATSDSAGDTPQLGVLKEKHHSIYPIVLSLSLSFSGFIFGWDIGTIGGVVSLPSFQNHFGTVLNVDGTRSFTDLHTGVIISIFNIGCAIGGPTLAKIGDWKGRKIGTDVSVILYLIGTIIQLSRDNSWVQFLIGRIICGLGIGSVTVLVPMFLSEIAPTNIRGAMVVLYQLIVTLGIVSGNIVNYCCFHLTEDPNSWMIPTGLGLLWGVLVLVGVQFIPESAPYLASVKLELEKARISFAKMNGVSVDDKLTTDFIEDMAFKYEKNLQEASVNRRSNFEFITGDPKLGLRLFVGMMVMAFQQLSGINYFFYYGTMLFKNAGMADPYIASIILSTVNFFSSFAGIYLVEKLGRKTCLLYGSISMFACMMVYASIGAFVPANSGSSIGMIAVTCVYIMTFAATLGPVTFVLVSELFPMRTKATSMATCTSVNWLMNFTIALLTPLITSKIGFCLGYVFAGCLLVDAVFTYFLIPETKNKNESEIDMIYSNNNDDNAGEEYMKEVNDNIDPYTRVPGEVRNRVSNGKPSM